MAAYKIIYEDSSGEWINADGYLVENNRYMFYRDDPENVVAIYNFDHIRTIRLKGEGK